MKHRNKTEKQRTKNQEEEANKGFNGIAKTKPCERFFDSVWTHHPILPASLLSSSFPVFSLFSSPSLPFRNAAWRRRRCSPTATTQQGPAALRCALVPSTALATGRPGEEVRCESRAAVGSATSAEGCPHHAARLNLLTGVLPGTKISPLEILCFYPEISVLSRQSTHHARGAQWRMPQAHEPPAAQQGPRHGP